MVINMAVGRWKAPRSGSLLLKETNTSMVMKMANGMVQYVLVWKGKLNMFFFQFKFDDNKLTR